MAWSPLRVGDRMPLSQCFHWAEKGGRQGRLAKEIHLMHKLTASDSPPWNQRRKTSWVS